MYLADNVGHKIGYVLLILPPYLYSVLVLMNPGTWNARCVRQVLEIGRKMQT